MGFEFPTVSKGSVTEWLIVFDLKSKIVQKAIVGSNPTIS